MESPARSLPPLGANGSQHRRFLSHHLPLVIGSLGLLALFTKLPLFDVNAYEHADVMTASFPQARATASMTDANPFGHAHSGRADHAGRTRDRSGHDATRQHRPDLPTADSGTIDHGNRGTERSDHGRDRTPRQGQEGASLSRLVQQLTVATGYVGVVLLAITLLLGPANLLLGRRNPVSSYLRRDVGIWTAIFSAIHVVLAVAIHVSHGSGAIASIQHFFVAEDGKPLTNSFGWGNWTGLAGLLIVLALLATSSDAVLRKMKATAWKWLQRLTYVLFLLVVLHAVFYGALLRMTSPFTRLLVVSGVAVLVGQIVGVWLWRRRHVSGARPVWAVPRKEQRT
jgi:sulfoxide reductase heme-binding subunit YedZ